MGGRGSGRSREATDAVEELLAATVRGDVTDASKWARRIDVARRHGASKMSGVRVTGLLRQVMLNLDLDAMDALANPPEHLGDIRVELGDGTRRWIEVKGQTKKENFADITQADYVRDGTDFLRRYVKENKVLDRLITGDLRRDLAIDEMPTFTAKWKIEDLWMADLALLESEAKKERAGVKKPADLLKFMDTKYLVHLTMEGVRFLKIAELHPVIAHRSGEQTNIELDISSTSKVAAIRIAVGVKPQRNTTDFTYHIGYKNSIAPGRHKLHNIAITNSPHLTVIR